MFRHVVLLAGAVVMLAPFVVDVSTSFKPAARDLRRRRSACCRTTGRPTATTPTAFTKVPLLRYLLNGVIVTAAIFTLQVLVALPAAYALAKLRFRGREAALRPGAVWAC